MTDDLRVRRAPPGWAALVLVGLLAGCAAQPAPQPILTESGPAGAAEATGRHFMVATADPAASEAALAILRQGGSAVDAAIAAQAVLGLVEPQSSGIGGGAFLLHWDGVTRKLSALDGRETAPKNARPDLFLDEDGKPVEFLDAALSGRSVGVPGVLRVLELAHRREGRLPWADLFQPAIDLAENGFALPPQLAHAIAGDPRLKDDPEARAYFFDAAGNPRPAGTHPAQSGLRRDIARDRRARRRRLLRRTDRAGDPGRGERRRHPAHVRHGPAGLPRARTRRAVPALSRLCGVQHGPADLRRHRIAADPRHPAEFRSGAAGSRWRAG